MTKMEDIRNEVLDVLEAELAKASSRNLKNKDFYESFNIACILKDYKDVKGRSRKIKQVIDSLNFKEKNICGDGRSGWYI